MSSIRPSSHWAIWIAVLWISVSRVEIRPLFCYVTIGFWWLMLVYADDPEIYNGAHVGLQLIGRRLQEEKVLAVTEYVAGVLTA